MTDYTGWFNKNQWPEYLKKCNLRHLSRASRLPDHDEELLRKAVEVNSALMERCVAGLSTFDNEIRRWLWSAKQSEPDTRPLGRLQNSASQDRYANYFAGLICYALHVLESIETSAETTSVSSDGYESSSEDRDGARSNAHSQPPIDVLKGARRLFPWHSE